MTSPSILIPSELIESGIKFTSRSRKNIYSGNSSPEPEHTQGIGWCSKYGQYVMTARSADSNTACLLLYNDYRRAGGNNAVAAAYNDAGKGYAHPSGIQIFEDTFPVGITNGTDDGDAYIYFYQIQNNAIVPASAYPEYIHHSSHIGAMAFATIGEYTFMIGLGWDAERMAIWRFKKDEPVSTDAKPVVDAKMEDLRLDNSQKLGAYNSCCLGYVESTGQYVLFASHGSNFIESDSWLDIWEIHGIADENPEIQIEKLAKNKMSVDTVGSWKAVFHEGMTLRVDGPGLGNVHVLASPHDYGGDPNKMSAIYELSF